jgi:hypothetical protein
MEPHERLTQAMRTRMAELRMKTWRELSVAADISYETVRATRHGENDPSEGTREGLERALQWAHGSVDAILNGGEPATWEDEADRKTAESEGRDPRLEKLAARVERLEASAERQRQENAELRRLLREITGTTDTDNGPQSAAQ